MNYDIAKLRQFIQKHFSAEELRTLLLDYFRPVWEDLTATMPKQQQVQMLLEHCILEGKFPELLAAIQRERSFFQPDDYIKEKQKSEKPLSFIEKAQRYAHDYATGKKKSKSNTFSSPVTQESSTRNPRQIFISYAHQDAEVAHQLANDLKNNNYGIWIAPDSINLGEKWAEAINRGFNESGIFLVVLTSAAINSEWVKDETNLAIDYEKKNRMKFIPVLLEKIENIPPTWKTYQNVDFTQSYRKGIKALIEGLGRDSDWRTKLPHKPVFENTINPKQVEEKSQVPEKTESRITSKSVSDNKSPQITSRVINKQPILTALNRKMSDSQIVQPLYSLYFPSFSISEWIFAHVLMFLLSVNRVKTPAF